jgi:NB-ARC domain
MISGRRLRIRRRKTARRIPVHVPLFLVGLGLALGASVGVAIGSVIVPPLRSFWPRIALFLPGVAVMAMSFFVSDPDLAPSLGSDRLQRPKLAPLIPGTSFIGHVPVLPSRYVARDELLGNVRRDIVSRELTALVGMGGSGKSLLATAIANDPTIQTVFPEGIIWLNAGQGASPKAIQERLAEIATGEPCVFPTLEAGRTKLSSILSGRRCLLIVDDVWNPEVIA